MNKYLTNFLNLYSDDDNLVYASVKEKQTWLNREFYLIMHLDDNSCLNDIFDNKLRFRKLYLNPYFFENQELYKEANNYFNDNFRVLYLLDELPTVDERSEFIVKVDFSKLSNSKYCELFPNYFPCVETNEINKVNSLELSELFVVAMNKELGDGVIIVSKDSLQDNCFTCDIISEIIMGKNMNDGYEPYLKKLSEAINASFRRLTKNDY